MSGCAHWSDDGLKSAEFKAPNGLIRIDLELDGDIISSISITGDFFMYPEDSLKQLEDTLVGAKADRTSLLARVEDFYSSTGVQTPMMCPEHWVEAIMCAIGG